MFYDFSPFFITGWRGKSEKIRKDKASLAAKCPTENV